MNYNRLNKLSHHLNMNPDIFAFNPTDYGLNVKQAAYLFHPHSYHRSHRSPKDVAKRLRYFLKSGGKVRTDTKAWNQAF